MPLPRLPCLVLLAITSQLFGCGGGGDSVAAPPAAPPPVTPPPAAADPVAALDAAAAEAFAEEAPASVPGMALAIYRPGGERVFLGVYGDFAPDERFAVASASKLVTSLVLLRLVDQQFLEFSSTTGAVLGWSGPQGGITLEQLLSFTSGLAPDADCLRRAGITLADCAAEIGAQPLVAEPGTRFDYGGSHMQVAARMAEVVTGSNWNAIFRTQLADPLDMPAGVRYHTLPRQRIGVTNPLAGGGLAATVDEYARLVEIALGPPAGAQNAPIDPGLVAAIFRSPYPEAIRGMEPDLAGVLGFGYGLGAWLECDTPGAGCNIASSAGLFGWMPWVDREAGYIGILAMEGSAVPGIATGFSVPLAERLRPLVLDVLGQ
jgi:D-alanyl-D-alanine-carboxypeptidase/D-alanyl-D-alanine-endopeptidase